MRPVFSFCLVSSVPAVSLVFILAEGSDGFTAVALAYIARSAVLQYGLSQLVLLAPQLTLMDPTRAWKPPSAASIVYPATYRH